MAGLVAPRGRVAHISASIADTADGRVVTTFCGKTLNESTLRVDESKPVCKTCQSKFDSAVEASDTLPE